MTPKLIAGILLLCFVTARADEASTISGEKGVIYGVQLHASSKDVIAKFGEPTALFKQNGTQILGYGRRHLFIFKRNELVETHITDSSHFYMLNDWIDSTHPLDNLTYSIEPGVHEEMLWDDAVKVLDKAGVQYRETGKHGLNEKALFYRVGNLHVTTIFTKYTSGEIAVTDIEIRVVRPQKRNAEQDGADQPATASESKSEDNSNPKPESEVRPQ